MVQPTDQDKLRWTHCRHDMNCVSCRNRQYRFEANIRDAIIRSLDDHRKMPSLINNKYDYRKGIEDTLALVQAFLYNQWATEKSVHYLYGYDTGENNGN